MKWKLIAMLVSMVAVCPFVHAIAPAPSGGVIVYVDGQQVVRSWNGSRYVFRPVNPGIAPNVTPIRSVLGSLRCGAATGIITYEVGLYAGYCNEIRTNFDAMPSEMKLTEWERNKMRNHPGHGPWPDRKWI